LEFLKKPAAKKSRASEARKAHGDAEAGRLADESMAKLRLPADPKQLAKLRRGDGRRVLVARLPRQRATAGNSWITQRLAMGHSDSVFRWGGESLWAGDDEAG